MDKKKYFDSIGANYVDPIVAWEKYTLERYESGFIQRTRKQVAVDLFGGSCQRCGYKKCLGALEFHHMSAISKKASVSSLLRGMTKETEQEDWLKALEELQKCVLLCSNCHREVELNDAVASTEWMLNTSSENMRLKAEEIRKKYHRD